MQVKVDLVGLDLLVAHLTTLQKRLNTGIPLEISEVDGDPVRKAAALLLSLVDRSLGGLGQKLFEAIAAIYPSVFMDVVLLREERGSGELQVFLGRRGPLEAYPNKLSVKGTFFRAGEMDQKNDYSVTYNRLNRKEYQECLRVPPELIDMFWIDELRGTCLGMVFSADFWEDPAHRDLGRWYSVDKIPPDAVEYQWRTSISRAVAEYRFRQRPLVRFLNAVVQKLVGGRVVRQEAFR